MILGPILLFVFILIPAAALLPSAQILFDPNKTRTVRLLFLVLQALLRGQFRYHSRRLVLIPPMLVLYGALYFHDRVQSVLRLRFPPLRHLPIPVVLIALPLLLDHLMLLRYQPLLLSNLLFRRRKEKTGR